MSELNCQDLTNHLCKQVVKWNVEDAKKQIESNEGLNVIGIELRGDMVMIMLGMLHYEAAPIFFHHLQLNKHNVDTICLKFIESVNELIVREARE